MTGFQFLRACAEHGAARIFRKAPRTLFSEAEAAYYDFAARFLTQYGSFPNMEAFAQARHPLTEYPTQQPAEAILGRLRDRYAFEGVSTRQSALLEAMKARRMDKVETTLREMLAEVSTGQNTGQAVSLAGHAPALMAQHKAARTHVGLFGASLGFPSLDAATLGLGESEIGLISGRPGTGKSWLLLVMAYANHLLGKSVLFISMEMGVDQVGRRFLGLMTGVNPNHLRTGTATKHEVQYLQDKISDLTSAAPIHIVSGDMSKDVESMETLIEEHDPAVVCVDAFYLMNSSAMPHAKRWETVTETTRITKQIIQRHRKPFIGTIQFNRNQKTISSGGMDLGDLGGSDAYGQDASFVLGMRPCPPPFTGRRLTGRVLKHREGFSPELLIEYGFDPVHFREVSEEETDDENALGEAANEWED